MENDDDPIGKALGLQPIETKIDIIDKIIADGHDDSAKKDFETARANIHEIIEDGKEAMFKLAEIASSSQHPRAFEVYAKLMDSLVAANQKLLDMQSKIREIDAKNSATNQGAKTINNNLFVGSTAELQKVLKEMKKDE